MARFRNKWTQFDGSFFLTDGGIETTMIYHERLELPEFAAFTLLDTAAGRGALENYYRGYATLARKYEVGYIFESATWRASRDWGDKLGYSAAALVDLNRQAIKMLQQMRSEYESERSPMLISGCIGPRGDGYVPTAVMSADEAQAYHQAQIAVFSETEADLVTGITMNYVEEAIGITRAAQAAGMPVVISFTLETDGQLPTGQSLGEAITTVDAASGGGPAYYMINCAHPQHFAGMLASGGTWVDRVRGIRANASTKSHAELNESTELDDGNPAEFGQEHRAMFAVLPHLSVFGGCCGTDERHVEAICAACFVAS